jgi:nitrogen fixation protein
LSSGSDATRYVPEEEEEEEEDEEDCWVGSVALSSSWQ